MSQWPSLATSAVTSRLANDSSVNDVERMRAARHSSVQASAAYVKRSSVSEMSKLAALGVVR